MIRPAPAEDLPKKQKPSLSRRSSTAVGFQGYLNVSSFSDISASIPSGTLYVFLRGRTLHLYPRDPFSNLEDGAAEVEEVATVNLEEGGWGGARRVTEFGKAGKSFQLIPVGAAMAKKRSASDLKSLAESTNIDKDDRLNFAEKMALRMRRAKSVSDRALIVDVSAPKVKAEPVVLQTDSSLASEQWVKAINFAFATNSSSPLPSPRPLSTSANSPTTRRPGMEPMTSFKFPPDFNAGRRPSFLDRPPPSPRSYATVPPVPTTPNDRDVPAWIQAVKASSSSSASTLPPPPPPAPEPSSIPLRPRRSRSGLGSSTLPGRQAPVMERTRSSKSTAGTVEGEEDPDATPLAEGHGSRKLRGFFGGKRNKKDSETPSSHLPLSLPSVYGNALDSTSNTSLPTSLTESHTSGTSTDFPATPEFPDEATAPGRAPKSSESSRMTRHATRSSSGPSVASHLSADESGSEMTSASSHTTWVTVDADSLDSEQYDTKAKSKDWRTNLASKLGSSSEFGSGRRQREASASTIEPSPFSSLRQSTNNGFVEHIVEPSELVAQMREETLRSFASSASTRHAPPSRISIGLSPPPRSMSRTSLSSLAAGRSPSKSNLNSPNGTPQKSETTPQRRRLSIPPTVSPTFDEEDQSDLLEITTPTRRRAAPIGGSGGLLHHFDEMTLTEASEDTY